MQFPDTFKVRRYTQVSDGQGGMTRSYVTDFSDVCLIRQLGADELVINQKLSVRSEHRLYCPYHNSDVTVSDILWVTKANETLSDVFEIERVDQRRQMGTGQKAQIQIDLFVRD